MFNWLIIYLVLDRWTCRFLIRIFLWIFEPLNKSLWVKCCPYLMAPFNYHINYSSIGFFFERHSIYLNLAILSTNPNLALFATNVYKCVATLSRKSWINCASRFFLFLKCRVIVFLTSYVELSRSQYVNWWL